MSGRQPVDGRLKTSLLMSNRIARVAFALAAVCAGVSLAYAATPTFWQVSNEAEFAKGDVEIGRASCRERVYDDV